MKELFSLKLNPALKESKEMKFLLDPKRIQKQLLNKTISCKVSAYPHTYIAFHVHCYSNLLLIWSNLTMRFHSAVIMKDKICEFEWSPENNVLVYFSREERLHFWSPYGVSCYPMKSPKIEEDTTLFKNLKTKKSMKPYKTTLIWKDPKYIHIVNKSSNIDQQSHFKLLKISGAFIDLIEYATLDIDLDFKWDQIENENGEDLRSNYSNCRGFAASTVLDQTQSTEEDDF